MERSVPTTPRHKRSGQFVAAQLFDGLEDFAELEARIAALPTTQDRGDAFEVFAEAYLATQKIVQADEVWPFDATPIAVLQELALDTPRDLGVDGVYRTLEGPYNAYQVKFRSGRPALRWGEELSTFMGLTDQVHQRVLFTNTDDLPPVMNDRSGFHCIRGTDLDRLTKDDLAVIAKWLRGSPIKFVRKIPLSHQKEALKAVLHGLEKQDRVTAVMACGTGKTLVALWLAERREAQRILVLVPSLALIRQTLHEWLKETGWERPNFLAVCSDPTVTRAGEDTMVVHQSDLDFPVTTDVGEARTFLESNADSVQVVFATYQSAHVVGKAAQGLPKFDLGIFDEAHKTAGREGAKFGFALADKNIPIAKRVFLTATPRHYDVQKRDKEGDKKLVYSMDVPETYGPVVHTLSFAEAAKRGIICDYKVIISVVTTDTVNNALLGRSQVLVEGEVIKARAVANQIALQLACEEHNLKKIFSFHRSVASAKDFTGDTASSIRVHLPDYAALHVNGAIPTARREKVMQAFRQADRAITSNARCLTEGVDVPAVDVVAFLSPRKSKVDIVQATGRAMRKSPGKARGYLLLPLFLETAENETIEDALERTGFEEAWSVLQAMQEQDAVLADIIRQMREERGRTGGFDDSRLRERIEVLGPELSLDVLREAVATSVIDRLGVSWDERYGELVAYKARFGNCDVPQPHNPTLANWVIIQRARKKQCKLELDRIHRLDSLGFDWDPRVGAWEEKFAELVQFKEELRHCNVPQRWPENPKLATWVAEQRTQFTKGKLEPERIERLEALGLVWDARAAAWEEKFEELVQFTEKHDHCNVPSKCPENPKLGSWVGIQRRTKSEGKLQPERIRRLDALRFAWDLKAIAWEERFAELVQFRQEHSDCNVPEGWPDNPKLATWVGRQRNRKKKGKLEPERVRRLEALGLVWDLRATLWEEKFAELVQFKEEHGHCNVPQRCPENPKLANWVGNQRSLKSRGKLESNKVERLETLGLSWDPHSEAWEEKFAELKQFKQKNGHCNVSQRWPDNPALANWVAVQRRFKNKGQMKDSRVKRLEALGFEWSRGNSP